MPLQCAPIFFKSKDSRDEVGAGRFVFPKPLGLLLVALCDGGCVLALSARGGGISLSERCPSSAWHIDTTSS